MSRRRSVLLIVPLLVLAAACQTVVTPDRVVEGGGQTVTVSSEPFLIPVNGCPSGSAVEVFIDDETEPAGTGTADGDGQFAIEITAPTEPGAYEVYATCSFGESGVTDLFPITLVVAPDLMLTVDPVELAHGTEFDVAGTWCVSQDDDSDVPTATVTFEGETQDLTATSPHPFGESWGATFTAPEAPGTYEVTATCTFDEVDPDVPFEVPELPLEQQAAPADVAPAAVDLDYDAVTVTVAVDAPVDPVDPVDPADPVEPPAPAPEAQPAMVEPAFTG